MTEGSRPSPKSAMKVVMNSRVIIVTAIQPKRKTKNSIRCSYMLWCRIN